jgi:prepilin-type N-terminal cleavage/methylation domain-containing protein
MGKLVAMAKIQICPATDTTGPGPHRAELGMTLFELLIALTIFATMTSFTGIILTANLRHLAFDSSTERLVDDLRRSQLFARTRDQVVVIELTASGYDIDQTSTYREWPADVAAEWRIRDNDTWTSTSIVEISPGRLSPLQLEITLTQDDDERHVRLEPVTGRVHAE